MATARWPFFSPAKLNANQISPNPNHCYTFENPISETPSETPMRATLFLTLFFFVSLPIFAQITTCDMPAENAEVTVDESGEPIKLITHYFGPPELTFTEIIVSKTLRQMVVTINGQQFFIDALVYGTSFGSEVMIYELGGQLRGLYGAGNPQDLINCTIQ